MEIQAIDARDPDTFGRYYAIMRAAELFGREQMPYWSEREAAVMIGHEEPGEEWHAYAAFEGEGDEADTNMVGAGLVILPLHDNTNFAFMGVMVAPEDRGRGIGSAMLDHVLGVARAAGRTHVLAETNLAFEDREHHPYRRFAEKRGFALANVEIRRVLDLPVGDEQLAAWIEEAAPHHEGYRIETYVDDVPDELLPSLVHVVNQLALDAPTGDLEFEAEAMTPETFKIRREKLKAMGRSVFETVAIAHDGDVVAQSTLAVGDDDRENAFQWGTLVRRDHRGHRLGLAIKARNLQAMQAAHPSYKRVVTTNSEVNAPMVGINELIGFKPVELLAEFQRTFDES